MYILALAFKVKSPGCVAWEVTSSCLEFSCHLVQQGAVPERWNEKMNSSKDERPKCSSQFGNGKDGIIIIFLQGTQSSNRAHKKAFVLHAVSPADCRGLRHQVRSWHSSVLLSQAESHGVPFLNCYNKSRTSSRAGCFTSGNHVNSTASSWKPVLIMGALRTPILKGD